jgi:hypothetical protein
VNCGVDLDVVLLRRCWFCTSLLVEHGLGQPAGRACFGFSPTSRETWWKNSCISCSSIFGFFQNTWKAWSKSSRWSRRFTKTAWSVQ